MADIRETIVTMTSIMNRCTFDEAGNARCIRPPVAKEKKADKSDER